jgi:8-oxo-dGTP pyrophosphatase MutT (NUDIX family)
MSAAVEARLSASVILVRDGGGGLQCFMVRRHARSPVMPSAYVFPGGTLREDDLSAATDSGSALARALSERSDTPVDASQAAALYVCAVRELFEEAGVLLMRDSSDRLLGLSDADTTLQERLAATRLALQARELSIGGVFDQFGLWPAFDLLVPFSHWITPKILAARFDTRFFVAALPPGQSALHDTIETSEGVWLSPRAMLEGDYHTVYATAQHLRRLSPYDSVEALLKFARAKPIRMVSPDVVESGEGLRAFIPDGLVDAW